MTEEEMMGPEAERILQVFRRRGLRSGGVILPYDFGEAIVWEDGFVRDETVRRALAELFESDYLTELSLGFELTDKGERYIYADAEARTNTTRCPTATPLLMPGVKPTLLAAFNSYPHLYDQVLEEVHARLNAAGFATKLDLAALVTWKHVQNASWMEAMLKLPPLAVQQRTQAAFAANKMDRDRIDALASIPGFGSGEAFTSVLLAAWRPSEFGVYDRLASGAGWNRVVNSACECPRADLPVYFRHLRQMAEELGSGWTPRDVDMALYVLGESE